VVVSKEGYDDYRQSVTIEGGKTSTVNAHLSVGSGEVDVVTTPPGLEVLIDGQSIGHGPAQATLPAGKHTYSVSRLGWQPAEGTIMVKSGKINALRVDMGGGAEATTGIIEVRTIPPGATVTADGNPVGALTTTSFRLTPGRHVLIISHAGYRSEQRVIEVKTEGNPPVDVRMTRQ
jgi:hypothetical protein